MQQAARANDKIVTLVNALGAVIWEFDWSTGAFTYVSDGAERLTGHPLEEWLAPGFWYEHVHPEDREWAADYCQNATREARDHEFEYRLTRADGSFIWVRDIVTVDKERRMDGALRGVLLDITAEKIAQDQSREVQERLFDLLDKFEVHALVVGEDDVIVFANTAMCHFHGRSKEDLIGHPIGELLPEEHRDEMRRRRSLQIEGTASKPFDFFAPNHEGELRHLVAREVLFRWDDERYFTLTTADDVTDRDREADEARRKSAEFDAVFRLLEDRYFRIDANGIFLDYKSTDVEALYASPEDFLGRPFEEIMPPAASEVLARAQRVASETHRVAAGEYRLETNGEASNWEARCLPLPDGTTAAIVRDVTDRVRREEALRESEERYRELVEIAPYAVAVVDLAGVVRFVNRASVALLECESAEELIGSTALSFIAAYEHSSVRETALGLTKAMQDWDPTTPAPFAVSARNVMITRKGHLIEVERSIACLRYEGHPALMIMMRDITAEQRAERELKESRDFLERVLSLIDCGVLLIDGETQQVKLANRPAELLFGLEPGALLKLPIESLEQIEDLPHRLLADVTRPLSAGETHQFETVLPRCGDQVFHAEIGVRRLHGKSGDVLAVVRDVSDRKAADFLLKESELRFRQVVDQAPFGMHFYSLDERGDLVLTGANKAADDILRFRHAPMIGKTMADGAPGLMQTSIPDTCRRLATDGGMWRSVVDLNGPIAKGTFELTIFQTALGQVTLMFQDVTERINAEKTERKHKERLSALTAQLADAEDQERRRLAEELHDRVSQPLAVARMHLRQVIAEGLPPEDEIVERAISLLEWAIAETRAITTELFPPVLYELGLPAAIRWLCDEMGRAHGLTCEDLIADVTVPLNDDAKTLVFRAARELLMNVVKHGRTDTALVSLAQTDESLVLTVADDGAGFDSQAEADTGQGFGLFSIRERVTNMGGKLSVSSSEGTGTTAQLVIPLSSAWDALESA